MCPLRTSLESCFRGSPRGPVFGRAGSARGPSASAFGWLPLPTAPVLSNKQKTHPIVIELIP